MVTWPILSVVTFLPLVGALLVWISRGDDEAARRNSRWIALWTTLVTFGLSLILVWRFDPAQTDFQFVEKTSWLATGITYHMGVDGISLPFVILTTALMPFCIIASWKSITVAGARIHDGVPDPGNADGRHLLRARPRAVLSVLRGRPDPDVPDHRRLGRSAPGLRLLQVLPLHVPRLGPDAARHHGAVLERRHHRHPDLDAHRRAALPADLGVAGVLRLLCGEDADVAGAHLAAGRACRGADRGLGDPGRDPPEDGRLRLPALLAADVPAGLARLRAADLHALGRSPSSTPRWWR